jgi:hypothetical protein
VRKWLRQQSKDFNAAGFDTLVKRWDKCIHVGGEICPEIDVHIGYWWESPKERDHWEDQDEVGWTILKWILER